MRGIPGFKPSVFDDRTLHVGRYFSGPAYDAPTPIQNWRVPAMVGMWNNDKVGCCTVSTICARVQQLCSLAGITCTLTPAEALAFYYDLTGGSDDGLMPIEVLTRLRATGIGKDAWLKDCRFARVNIHDPVELRAALWAFGFVYLGASLPKRIDKTGTTWTRPPPDQRDDSDKIGSLGGHAFGLYGAQRGRLGLYTWSEDVASDDDWLDVYGDEGWVIKDSLWTSHSGVAPNGFDDARLEADLAAIGARP